VGAQRHVEFIMPTCDAGRARPDGCGFVLVTPLSCTGAPFAFCVRETDRNFGFNLPWWDRCGTYRAQPDRRRHDLGCRSFAIRASCASIVS